jgi:hypothetical protein
MCHANMNGSATLDMTLLRPGRIELYRKWSDERDSVLLAATSLDIESGKPWLLLSERELKEALTGSGALQPANLLDRLAFCCRRGIASRCVICLPPLGGGREGARGRVSLDAESDTARMRLDIKAVVAASHALSSEIVLSRLLEVLIENVLKHAGAERCAVALRLRGELRVEAEARTSLDGVSHVIESRQLMEVGLPVEIFMSVARTGRRVLLDDASCCGQFTQDPYVKQRRLRSVLCMPLLKQNELVGMLYAEK